ncbi:MAG: hypothetical protein ACYDHE_11320 [Candidatus Acidiferrales bacterium]
MPTINQLVEKNRQRIANLPKEPSPEPIVTPRVSAPAPITFAPTPELPLRSTFPPALFAADGVTAGSQPARPALRSSVWSAPGAISNNTTPATLNNKKLIAPIIGNGSPLRRYNSIKVTIVPLSVGANSQATQTFVVAGVQATDKLAGFQWGSAQLKGVVTLAVRVFGTNQIAIDFYNPTSGSLVPTGGSITLFLFQ